MYVLVVHNVTDRHNFFDTAAKAIPNVPDHLKLHLTVPARDGAKAICVWEAESTAAVREFLEPALGGYARNEYYEAENHEGIALPSQLGEPLSA
jgi:hypothetical protein